MKDQRGTLLFVYRPGNDEPEIVSVVLPAQPQLADLKAAFSPFFRADANFEHVSVLFRGNPADMFVDETGIIDGLPRNEKATEVYRSAWLNRHPYDDPETLPHIAGPAIIPNRKVWS